MKISVLGCGRWGTFLAWYSSIVGHGVKIWGRKDSEKFLELSLKRQNQYLTLPENVAITDSLEETLSFGEIIIISISTQGFRSLCKKIDSFQVSDKTFILCMKGIEATTGKRLSQIFREEILSKNEVAVWLGPGHVQDFVNRRPNVMLLGSENIETTKFLVEQFKSELIRFYYGQDMIGNEIGAASKNVMGIAAGMLDGLKLSNLKGALMARGIREISRLIRVMGGNELTAYGLSHLGDYEATLFSPHSHNRKFGESLVLGKKFDKLAEGVPTLQGLMVLSKNYEVELPICQAAYNIVFEKQDPKEVLKNLFIRSIKFEF